MTGIDEPVAVVASFGDGGRIRPLRFRWGGRVIQVEEVTYRWTQYEGRRKLYFFSITDGGALYNLSFDPAGLRWMLKAVETEF
jgi:hypothetical protein